MERCIERCEEAFWRDVLGERCVERGGQMHVEGDVEKERYTERGRERDRRYLERGGERGADVPGERCRGAWHT